MENLDITVTFDDLNVYASENYEDLRNKPKINGVELIYDKSAEELNLQRKLTAGENITIENNVISAADTEYSAGNGITIEDETISINAGDGVTFNDDGELIIDSTVATVDYVDDTAEDLQDAINEKQDTLTAGTNITIENNVISATGEPDEYIKSASVDGNKLTLVEEDGTEIEYEPDVGTIDYEDLENKPQINDVELSGNLDIEDLGINVLEAGTNITISNGTINATDTTYTAGTNITIDANNEISATDTVYTAGTGIDITNNVISATNADNHIYIDKVLQKGSYNTVTLSDTSLTEEQYNAIWGSNPEQVIFRVNVGTTITGASNQTFIFTYGGEVYTRRFICAELNNALIFYVNDVYDLKSLAVQVTPNQSGTYSCGITAVVMATVEPSNNFSSYNGTSLVNFRIAKSKAGAEGFAGTDSTLLTRKAVKEYVAEKSTVSVSETGTATDEINYITVDGVEKKIAGGTKYSAGNGVEFTDSASGTSINVKYDESHMKLNGGALTTIIGGGIQKTMNPVEIPADENRYYADIESELAEELYDTYEVGEQYNLSMRVSDADNITVFEKYGTFVPDDKTEEYVRGNWTTDDEESCMCTMNKQDNCILLEFLNEIPIDENYTATFWIIPADVVETIDEQFIPNEIARVTYVDSAIAAAIGNAMEDEY